MHKKKVVDLQNYRHAGVEDEDFVSDAASHLLAGTPLLHGQYTILEYINCGGFGITYVAQDSFGRKVAIKECFPCELSYRVGNEMRPRSLKFKDELFSIVDHFVDEAQRLSRLEHKNIVHVHQVFEENATAYLVMDYIDGPDLLDIAESDHASLTPEAIEELSIRMLGAISYVHDQGILHRDIAPDNILVSRKGEPVLIDFGASVRTSERKRHRPSRLKFVKDGYSPHEFYVVGDQQSQSSDLYSFAASLYHVISGVRPDDASTRLAAVAAKDSDPFQPLTGRFQGYSAGFLACIDETLAVLPEDRISSAHIWLERLGFDAEGESKVSKLPAAPVVSIERLKTVVAEKAFANRGLVVGGCMTALVALLALIVSGSLPVEPLKNQAPQKPPFVLAENPVQPDTDTTSGADPRETTIAPAVDAESAAVDVAPSIPVNRNVVDRNLILPEITLTEGASTIPRLPNAAAQAPRIFADAPLGGTQPGLGSVIAVIGVTDIQDGVVDREELAALSTLVPAQTETPDFAVAPLTRVTLTSAISGPALPSELSAKLDAVVPFEVVDKIAELAPLPVVARDTLFDGDFAPPALFEEPGALQPAQVAFSHWIVDMPFKSTLDKVHNANTAEITDVSPKADLAVSGAWIKKGVILYSFNGERLVPDMPISDHVLDAVRIDPDGYIRASVRYRDPETGTIDRGLLAVPVARQIGLADGSVIEARMVDLDLTLTVVQSAAGSGLQVGDQITSEIATGMTFERFEDLAVVLESLVARGESTANFAVKRGDDDVLVFWQLAQKI